jgi:hypothetical protein
MSNKLMTVVIAFGLWANAAATFTRPAQAQFGSEAVSYPAQISYATEALRYGGRNCLNTKICD